MIEESIIMKDYYVAIDFEHNEIGFYSKRICSVNHIFYNQPDEVNNDLKNYWLCYLKKLLDNLYNTEVFNPILDNNNLDIYEIPDYKNNTKISKNHRFLQDKEHKKDLKFHAKMFKQENDFVSINEDLIKMRNNIPEFKSIKSFFSKVKF